MAKYEVTRCDLCGALNDVDTLTVQYEHKRLKQWQADVCFKCYEDRFGDLVKVSRKPEKSTSPQRYRFQKTEITDENL